MNSTIIKTFEFTDPHDIENNGGKRFLDLSIDYTLGGYSGLDWTKKERGYRLDITPYNLNVREYNGKKYTSRETSYGGVKSGGFVFLVGTTRKSAKKMQSLADAMQPVADTLKAHWLNSDNDQLIATAKSVV